MLLKRVRTRDAGRVPDFERTLKMKHQGRLALAALVVAMSMGSAMAQPGPGQGGPGRQMQGGPGHGGPGQWDHGAGQDRGRPGPGMQQPGRPGPDRAGPGPGGPGREFVMGPDRRYVRGDRLPPAYRGHNYVVDDWRAYRLAPPPRGQHWVQIGADYALIAIATGVSSEIVLGR